MFNNSYKEIALRLFTVFFILNQGFCLYSMNISDQITETDISSAAGLLRVAVINSSGEQVLKIINLCKKCFQNKMKDVLYDTQTSIGKKTILEDLFCYRRQDMGAHKEILAKLVTEFRGACLLGGCSEYRADQELTAWMLYTCTGSWFFPSLINLDSYKDADYFIDLFNTFFEDLEKFGGMSVIKKVLNTPICSRGFSVRYNLLSQLPNGYRGCLITCN